MNKVFKILRGPVLVEREDYYSWLIGLGQVEVIGPLNVLGKTGSWKRGWMYGILLNSYIMSYIMETGPRCLSWSYMPTFDTFSSKPFLSMYLSPNVLSVVTTYKD